MNAGLPSRLSSLLGAAAYPHPVTSVQLVETHISWVLLTGQFAYKIKRPVKYAFVDLRGADRRAFFCAEELRLNRRFAPELYIDVCDITLAADGARIGGPGEVIERAVRMRQFDRSEELDRLLARGAVTPAELETFGRDFALIHAVLPLAQPDERYGCAATVNAIVLENFEQCAQASHLLGTEEQLRVLREKLVARLEAAESSIARRRAEGRVRECHGDLHSRNIVRYAGRLHAFDSMEFEPAFRWIDIADDIAFLLMDLEAQGASLHAQAFRGGYLAQSGDYGACRVLRLYEIHRALVRAKVAALEAAAATDPAVRETTMAQHRAYLDCARGMLAPQAPTLLLMHGLSGSGKTWLAQQLASALGAVHLRSDVERKRLAGLAEHARSNSEQGQGLYAREISERVYQRLAQCAEDSLTGGFSTIVDAAFQRREERALLRELALRHGVRLQVIRCGAPRPLLEQRLVERRKSGADASEADVAVLRWQEGHLEPIDAAEGLAVIDAETTRAQIVAEVFEAARRAP